MHYVAGMHGFVVDEDCAMHHAMMAFMAVIVAFASFRPFGPSIPIMLPRCLLSSHSLVFGPTVCKYSYDGDGIAKGSKRRDLVAK